MKGLTLGIASLLLLSIMLVGFVSADTGSNASNCVQKDNSCCIGDSCDYVVNMCALDIAIFKGCDENCKNIWKCEPEIYVHTYTCDGSCKSSGYSSGRCNQYPVVPNAERCASNEIIFSGPTLDCHTPKDIVGVGSSCCCSVLNETNDSCSDTGLRQDGKYCLNTWQTQKEAGKTCENSFECSSNVCANSQCISGSLIQKILNWFSRLFGG